MNSFRTSLVLPVLLASTVAGAIALKSQPAQANLTAAQPFSPSIPIFVPPPEQPSVGNSTPNRAVGGNWLAFAQPNASDIEPLNLWATYYFVHQANSTSRGYRLLDMNGRALGPLLSQRDWCMAAMQGVVQVPNRQGSLVTYGFAGRGSRPQVNCSAYFKSLSKELLTRVGSARFKLTTAPYGYASGRYRATPFRTIAVDRTQIPIGSVLYIPAAKGVTVTLPSGEQVVHDGYFYAADVGSAIKGNHIDVFIGPTTENPFAFVRSRAAETFEAYLVKNPEIEEYLRSLHQLRP